MRVEYSFLRGFWAFGVFHKEIGKEKMMFSYYKYIYSDSPAKIVNMIDRFVRLVKAPKIWSQIKEKKLTKKQKMANSLLGGEMLTFNVFQTKV